MSRQNPPWQTSLPQQISPVLLQELALAMQVVGKELGKGVLGISDGAIDGTLVGVPLLVTVGEPDSLLDGTPLGFSLLSAVGETDGDGVGMSDSFTVGERDGGPLGSSLLI